MTQPLNFLLFLYFCPTTSFSLSPPPPPNAHATFTLTSQGGVENIVEEQEFNSRKEPPLSLPSDVVSDLYSTSIRSFRFFDDDPNSNCCVDVRQTSFSLGKLGASVWGSSISLASWLFAHKELVKGKRVLELGAGCGLPGLICARLCGASSVTLTDFWEAEENKEREDLVRLLPDFLFATNLHYNVDLNGLADIVSVERLDWHDPSNLGDFDLIVGSDLVYNIYDVLPLLSVVDSVLTDGNLVLLFIPLPPAARREALPLFLEELDDKRKQCWLVEKDEMTFKGFGDNEAMLRLAIRRKR